MQRSIIGCAIVVCFFSSSLFAGDARVTVRKASGEQIQSATATDIPANDSKNAFEKEKQELKDIVDRIMKLGGHATTIDWGDGTPPPSLTVTIDWGDGSPPSSLTVTNVVARVRWGADAAMHVGPNSTAHIGSAPAVRHEVGKLSPDDIRKAKELFAEYNSKRDAYALEKPNGNYFASLPRLESDPIELKTNSLLDQQVPSKRDAAASGGEGIGIGQIGRGGVGKYLVWVYKSEGGQWVKQPERTLNTEDAKAATDYVVQVNAAQGWMATTNVPEDQYLRRKLPGKMKSGQLQSKMQSGDKESLDPNSGAPSGRRMTRP